MPQSSVPGGGSRPIRLDARGDLSHRRPRGRVPSSPEELRSSRGRRGIDAQAVHRAVRRAAGLPRGHGARHGDQAREGSDDVGGGAHHHARGNRPGDRRGRPDGGPDDPPQGAAEGLGRRPGKIGRCHQDESLRGFLLVVQRLCRLADGVRLQDRHEADRQHRDDQRRDAGHDQRPWLPEPNDFLPRAPRP